MTNEFKEKIKDRNNNALAKKNDDSEVLIKKLLESDFQGDLSKLVAALDFWNNDHRNKYCANLALVTDAYCIPIKVDEKGKFHHCKLSLFKTNSYYNDKNDRENNLSKN